MKVTSVSSPAAIVQAPAVDRRAAAVAAFNSAQTGSKQPTPAHSAQLDQNAISPEDMSAIMPNRAEADQEVDNLTNSVEASAEETETSQAPPSAPAKPKEDPALSRQFAQLARQEKALRAKVQQQDQALRAREEALKAREAAVSAKDQEYSQGYISRDRLKQDTLSALAEANISYDELTNQILNQAPKDPRVEATISRLEAKIKALEEQNTSTQKSHAEQQAQAYQAAVKQIELDTRNLVKNDPTYETIKATGAVKDVVELITQTYDKDGILLSVEEAAQQVEDYLVDEAIKITRIGKIKRRLEQSAQTAKASAKPPATQKQTQPMKTLTNATSTSRELSARERAVLAFKGQLNRS